MHGSIPEIESVSTYRLDHERILEQLLDACQMNDSAACCLSQHKDALILVNGHHCD
jgi:hypothetical protein